jgi:hypothetical protein
MKKTQTSVIIALIALVSTALAEQTWVEFTKGAEGEPPQLTVLESSFAGTTINLKTHGAWVKAVTEGKTTYLDIEVPSASYTTEVGKPKLPIINRLVAIPPTAGVKVTVLHKNETVIKDVHILPAQPPDPEAEPGKEFQIDTEFYVLDTLYPDEHSKVGAPAVMRDVRLVRLSLQPFRYNPATKELRVATDITIHLDYSGFDGRNVLKTKRSQFLPQWEQIYRTQILNFDDLYNPPRVMGSGPGNLYPGYLIIYAHDFRPAVCPKLQEFIDWKEEKGQHIYKADLNDIPGIDGNPDDAENLKTYIQYWYDNMDPTAPDLPCYVLLVGDAPSHGSPPDYDLVQCAADDRVPTYWYSGALTSDYWYQLLSGSDNYPEIALGRWCIEHPESLFVYVDKTFAYEKDPDPAWQGDKSTLVAHKEPLPDSGDPVGASLRFELAKDTIYNNVLPSGYDYELLYGAEGATNTDLIQAITTYGGTGIINYRGHGLPTSWHEWDYDDQSFTTTQMRDLDQTSFDGYPVVYNLCCSPGPITNPTECVIEAWTRNPTGGCAGALGAPVTCYTKEHNTFDTTIFRGHFYPNTYFTRSLNCGMAINNGKVAMLTYHGDGENKRGTLHA